MQFQSVILLALFHPNIGQYTTQELIPNDPGLMSQYFGSSVSIYDTRLVIGSAGDDNWGLAWGSAYVYEWDASSNLWKHTAKLGTNNGARTEFFGISVSVYGNYIAVGNQMNQAYIFEHDTQSNTGTWSQTALLTPNDNKQRSDFVEVSIYDPFVVVGVPDGDCAFVFKRDSTTNTWSQTAKLIPQATNGGSFGSSVAIYDTYIIIGAPSFGTGTAYIYQKDPQSDQWTETVQLSPADLSSGDIFGASVSIRDGYAGVGAIQGEATPGCAYIFEQNQATNIWTQTAKLLADDGSAGDTFGESISIFNSYVMVGSSSGSAYLYERNQQGNDWIQIARPAVDPSGYFYEVAMYGSHVVCGSMFGSKPGMPANSGYAHALLLQLPSPNTLIPSGIPSHFPTDSTAVPSPIPSVGPSNFPSKVASTAVPSSVPSTAMPSPMPSGIPSNVPIDTTAASSMPSTAVSSPIPSDFPSNFPSKFVSTANPTAVVMSTSFVTPNVIPLIDKNLFTLKAMDISLIIGSSIMLLVLIAMVSVCCCYMKRTKKCTDDIGNVNQSVQQAPVLQKVMGVSIVNTKGEERNTNNIVVQNVLKGSINVTRGKVDKIDDDTDIVLQEIEGDGGRSRKVEMRYTHEGPTDTETMGATSNEGNVCVHVVDTKQTSKGDAIDNV